LCLLRYRLFWLENFSIKSTAVRAGHQANGSAATAISGFCRASPNDRFYEPLSCTKWLGWAGMRMPGWIF